MGAPTPASMPPSSLPPSSPPQGFSDFEYAIDEADDDEGGAREESVIDEELDARRLGDGYAAHDDEEDEDDEGEDLFGDNMER